MILELFEDIVLLIIPLALICIICIIIFDFLKATTIGKLLKGLFCIFLTTQIVVSIFFVMFFNVYQVASIWKEAELKYVVEPWMKSVSFIAVELTWSLIAVGLLFLLWRFVYYHQIIPGEGNAKARLKTFIKKDVKKLGE